MVRTRETFVPLFGSGPHPQKPKRRRLRSWEWGGLLFILLLAGIAVWQLGSTQPSFPMLSSNRSVFSPPPPASLAIITRYDGPARVTDANNMTVEGGRVRLFGIDAPDGGQTCSRADGRSWPCGAEAADALRRLVAGARLACIVEYRDSAGRAVCTCHAGGVDVGAEMVRAGMATADRRYSTRYVADEADAHRRRAGLWDGTFEAPRDWRGEEQSLLRPYGIDLTEGFGPCASSPILTVAPLRSAKGSWPRSQSPRSE